MCKSGTTTAHRYALEKGAEDLGRHPVPSSVLSIPRAVVSLSRAPGLASMVVLAGC